MAHINPFRQVVGPCRSVWWFARRRHPQHRSTPGRGSHFSRTYFRLLEQNEPLLTGTRWVEIRRDGGKWCGMPLNKSTFQQ